MPKKMHRNLSIRMHGDDVKGLREALVAGGSPVKDKLGYFGRETRSAVQAIQKRFGLKVTGVVNQAFPDFVNNPAIVRGRVTQPSGSPIVGGRIRVITELAQRKKVTIPSFGREKLS